MLFYRLPVDFITTTYFPYSQVLSRHSSPASSPPMVGSSQAERLHKACDVLLRAASKIQDLPPGIQQEEVVVEEEGESITLYTNADPLGDIPNEQITIRHNPVPLYEINFSSVNAINDPNRSTKKIKSRDKLQVRGRRVCTVVVDGRHNSQSAFVDARSEECFRFIRSSWAIGIESEES